MELENYFTNSRVIPTGEDYYKCSAIMSRLRDFAPSDSTVSATIYKMDDGKHQVTIAIKASQGEFIAQGQPSSLVASLKEATEQMMDRLHDWKLSRFKHVDL